MCQSSFNTTCLQRFWSFQYNVEQCYVIFPSYYADLVNNVSPPYSQPGISKIKSDIHDYCAPVVHAHARPLLHPVILKHR